MTIATALSNITEAFFSAGLDTPALDARLILAHALKKEAAFLIAHPAYEISEAEIVKINSSVNERLNHRPVAYIIGEKDFYNSTFLVNENVLIPRPDTETVLEAALLALKDFRKSAPHLLDLCCGSGAIGLSAALENKDIVLTLSDISKEALEVCAENAKRLGLSERAIIIESDLFEEMEDMRFDVIVSNPPYVTADEMKSLPSDIRAWEPHEALFGGSDGLSFYRQIIAEAAKHLNKSGVLVLEIGAYQAYDIKAIAEACGWKDIKIIKDLAGNDRAAVLKRGKEN